MRASRRIVSLIALGKANMRLNDSNLFLHPQVLIKRLRLAIVPQRIRIAVLTPGKPGGTEGRFGPDGRGHRVVGARQQRLELFEALGQIVAHLPIPGERASQAQAGLAGLRTLEAETKRHVQVVMFQAQFLEPHLLLRVEKSRFGGLGQAHEEIQMLLAVARGLVMLRQFFITVIPYRFQHGVAAFSVRAGLDHEERFFHERRQQIEDFVFFQPITGANLLRHVQGAPGDEHREPP